MPRDRSAVPFPRAAAFVALVALSGACGDEGPPRIDRIEVTAESGGNLEVMKGELIVLKAKAFSGTKERIDALIRFKTENPEIAAVDSILGRAIGIEYGTAQIAVTANNEFTARFALQVVGPAIARIVIVPASAGTTIGGTVQLTGIALNSRGDTIAGAEFRWRSTSPSIVQLDATGSGGVATGVAAGVGSVEAVAWNNLRGTATVSVLPVRDFVPREGAFGAVIGIVGANLAPPVKVAFAAGLTTVVEAEVQRVTSDTIYTWVPVGARSGPLTVTLGSVSARTAASFTVTGGGDDALEQNDEPTLDSPQFPIGSYNPALIAVPNDQDWFLIPITQSSGTFTLEISVRKGSGITQSGDQLRVDSLLQAAFFRLEPPDASGSRPLRWMGGYPAFGFMSYDFTADTAVRTLRTARRILEPDTFVVLVIANSQGSSMPYGLRVRDTGVYTFGPDEYEENDAPIEAKPVTFPSSFPAFAENGGELDFYSFTLGDSARVRARLSGAKGDLDVWLGTETLSLDSAIAKGDTPAPNDSLTATLKAGKYVLGVWEFAMRGDAYTLTLERLPFAAPPGVAGEAAPVAGPDRRASRATVRPGLEPLRLRLRLPLGSPFRIVPPWSGWR
ncbi:MAG: hypothetical protein HY704_00435 [Gemmatimonadetes bacterium]|nr:hypothetical protein [Gemmatimonadota bacterium]